MKVFIKLDTYGFLVFGGFRLNCESAREKNSVQTADAFGFGF